MTTEKAEEKENAGVKKEIHKVIFHCKFCGNPKKLDELRTLTRFFPPITVCRECERKML